jgi:hypothetical protein
MTKQRVNITQSHSLHAHAPPKHALPVFRSSVYIQIGGQLPGGLHLRGLSGGERKRLGIAAGVLAAPSVLFLDEPTSGLDSAAALTVMRWVRAVGAGCGCGLWVRALTVMRWVRAVGAGFSYTKLTVMRCVRAVCAGVGCGR